MRFGCVTLNFPLCFSSSIQYTRDATLTFISQQIDGSSRSKLVFCIYSNEKFQLFGDLNQKKKKNQTNERHTETWFVLKKPRLVVYIIFLFNFSHRYQLTKIVEAYWNLFTSKRKTCFLSSWCFVLYRCVCVANIFL